MQKMFIIWIKKWYMISDARGEQGRRCDESVVAAKATEIERRGMLPHVGARAGWNFIFNQFLLTIFPSYVIL